MSQDSSSEEDLALADAEEVAVEFKCLNLQKKKQRGKRDFFLNKVGRSFINFKYDIFHLVNSNCRNNILNDFNYKSVCTIRSQACLPSMKPLGMALGVRISYLDTDGDIVRTKLHITDSD